jgi:hypothetical protein
MIDPSSRGVFSFAVIIGLMPLTLLTATLALALAQGGAPNVESRGKFRVITLEPGVPNLLQNFCFESKIIAIGVVDSIHRRAFTPFEGTGPMQHTVYRFKISTAVKGPSCVLLVRQNQGDLRFGEFSGTSIEDQPRLKVGTRYLLFLNYAVKQKAGEAPKPISGTIHGISGVMGFSNELLIFGGVTGMYAIEKGLLKSTADEAPNQLQPMEFHDLGRSLAGLSESDAVAEIRKAIARMAADLERNRKILDQQSKGG